MHVLGALNPGGIEVMVMNLYRAIDRSRVQFDFVIHTADRCFYEDEIEQLGGRVFRVPSFRGYNILSYKKAWKAFFRQHDEFSCIHGHMGSSAAYYLGVAKRFGIPTVAHSHGTTRLINLKEFLYLLFSFPTRFVADTFFACSLDAGRDRFGKRVAASSRFRIVRNAFDLAGFGFFPEERALTRRSLGLERAFIVGHVGRFDVAKNHAFILKVFREVLARVPEARLLLVGDGDTRPSVEALIADYGLEEQVILLGTRHDVPSLLQAMDVFLFPSLLEGLGISLIEAQCTGLPGITSNRVPREVGITDLVTFLDLKDTEEKWAEEVCSYRDMDERHDRLAEAEKAGYEITRQTMILEEFYLDLHSPS